jgi:hypothetical protein
LLCCVGIDPGKINIVMLDSGPKLDGNEYHSAPHAVPTPEQTKMLNDAKAAEEASLRMEHHFRVLTMDRLWNAVRVAHATALLAQALKKQYAQPATMKRGLTVYARVQQGPSQLLT